SPPEGSSMMSQEQNQLITRVGPGTGCGALMRHYWHPVALTDELPDERPAKAVRVLGQDFVLFRDERGRHGARPVAWTEDSPDGRPAKAVGVLGRAFVLFRDERARHGLLDRGCPHR